jgi:hypothetical protein
VANEAGGIDFGRFGRTLALISAVTGVFIMLTVNRLDSPIAEIGLFAVGAVALFTAMIGFLIAAGSMYDE